MEYQEKDNVVSFSMEEEAPGLTEWNNEPTVRDLKQDLQEASSDHSNQVAKIDKWLDNLNITGSAQIKKVKGRSRIVPKLIRKQAEWRYSALSEPFLSTEDLFQTAPVSWEDKKAAIQNGLILNNQFNTQIDKTKFIDEYVRAAVNEGTVITRVGWEYEEEEVEVEVPVMEVVPIQDPNKIREMMEQGLPLMEEQVVGTKIEKEIRVIKNQPTVEVCDYAEIIIDPTCKGNFDNANFVIFPFETSLSDLEKAGIYKNLDKIDVENVSAMDGTDENFEKSSFKFADKPRKRFVAHEYWGYWDIDGSGITKPIVATWVNDVMIRMEENPFPDGKLPFVIEQYLPKRKSVYGEPDGELLEDNQKVIGAVTRGMIDIMGRSAAGQTGVRQDALDITNRRRYEAGEDYEFNANVDPRQAFFTHIYPEIPNSAQFMVSDQKMDAESLTGVKAFHEGMSGNSLGNTATGVRGALDAASKRELGILRRLANGVVRIGRKIMAMNAEFLSEEEIVRISNEEFQPVKRDDLAGKVDIKLHISTAETDNAKAQELSFMLQTMGNNMAPEMSQMILADIARLRKMPELAKRIEEYQPKPDPMEQEMKVLTLEKLKAEVLKLQGEAEHKMSGSDLNEAKARQTEAETDMLDLDFLEQESGVKQSRDMEKQGAQAQANMKLKALEHSLKGSNDIRKEQVKNQMSSRNM